jgi:phosphatidylglycerophosphatase A
MNLKEPRWPALLPGKWVEAIATLGPLGTNLPAPGTWGAAAGVFYTVVAFRHPTWWEIGGVTLLASYLAVGITGEAARRIGKTDPGEVILDEFVVMPLVYLGTARAFAGVWPIWVVLAVGFAWFRFFDILKPLGISRLQRWPGGWGIVADDFAAALAACAALHLTGWVWLRF